MIGDALLTHLSSIGTLSAEDARAIRLLGGRIRAIPRHKDIVSAGDIPRCAVIVLEGLLCRYTTSASGARQIHGFCIPTDAPLLDTLHLDYLDDSLGSLVASLVGLVSHESVFQLMEERPAVAALIWRAGVLQSSIQRQWLMRNSTQPATASTAHLLCEMYVRADAAGLARNGCCAFPVTQTNLGDALGLTAVHVNRTLKLLGETGATELKRGTLFIKDLNNLAKLAEFDPHYLHVNRGAGSLSRKRRRDEDRLRARPQEAILCSNGAGATADAV